MRVEQSLSVPGRLVRSDLIGAGNIQMVNVRQDHIVPNSLVTLVSVDGKRVDHRKVHPNRSAPRCLPCGYQDPLHQPNGTSTHVPLGSFRAPEVGCTHSLIIIIVLINLLPADTRSQQQSL